MTARIPTFLALGVLLAAACAGTPEVVPVYSVQVPKESAECAAACKQAAATGARYFPCLRACPGAVATPRAPCPPPDGSGTICVAFMPKSALAAKPPEASAENTTPPPDAPPLPPPPLPPLPPTKASSSPAASTTPSAPMKDTLPYTRGEPIPAGYRLESRLDHVEHTVLGGALLGGGHLAMIGLARSIEDAPRTAGWLYVPLLGPFAFVLAEKCDSAAEGDVRCSIDTGFKAIIILDGLVQILGVGYLVHGLASTEELLVRTPKEARRPSLRVSPYAFGHSGGLILSGRF